MARWIVFTDNGFWKYSWAHAVISFTVALLFLMQCRFRARRSRAFSMVLRPWPLRTEIFPDSLNLLMILFTVDDDNCKLFAIFRWVTPLWYCSTIFLRNIVGVGDPLPILASERHCQSEKHFLYPSYCQLTWLVLIGLPGVCCMLKWLFPASNRFLSQLFWDLLTPWNFEWAYFSLISYNFSV